MPCGGVYTVKPLVKEENWYDRCALCGLFEKNGKTTDHYIEEWDGFMLHGECVLAWLKTDEGSIVNDHLHEVQIDGKVVYAEGQPRE
jgi:hypothetical protein